MSQASKLPKNLPMDKEKFLTWCVVKLNLAKNTLHHTSCRFDYIFRWLSGRPLNSETASLLILHLRERGLRNTSINAYISCLQHLDQYLVSQGKKLELLKEISYFPKQHTVPTILTIEEINRIISIDLKYALRNGATEEETEKINRTYKLAIWTMAATGGRYSEVMGLKKENLSLNLVNGQVEFKETKNGDDRKVFIPPTLVLALRDWTKELKPNQLIFTTTKGKYIEQQNFNPDLRKRVEKAGINKHVTCHDFRHSFIDEHRRRKTPTELLSKLCGHNDINSTLRYGSFAEDLLKQASENHPLFSQCLKPEMLINKDKVNVENLSTFQDSRFEKRVEITNYSITYHCTIKEQFRG